MLCWVIYDIESNKIRNKVAKKCLDVGLYRVQKSVFLGDIEKNVFDEINLYFENIINQDSDSVYVFPTNKTNLRESGLIGQAFDKELISDEIRNMFL